MNVQDLLDQLETQPLDLEVRVYEGEKSGIVLWNRKTNIQVAFIETAEPSSTDRP